MQQAGQVPYLDQNDAHEQSLGQSVRGLAKTHQTGLGLSGGSLPGPEQTLNQSINTLDAGMEASSTDRADQAIAAAIPGSSIQKSRRYQACSS